jgi:hypothetical protein
MQQIELVLFEHLDELYPGGACDVLDLDAEPGRQLSGWDLVWNSVELVKPAAIDRVPLSLPPAVQARCRPPLYLWLSRWI